ncbi:GIY-YIG nuclease family protein [Macrococcus armenti]|uniref:GIY-YIG nuclease family protein n=1 Tax=Macrococcus armenti TaxID=2875764 RepID=UPI001CD24118|nr:GIY-YIG nuclease family protein [Macrococcus armenti]UBH10064.1 GIY-YIG nuclease family protein [Macrococcus armenti]
MSIIFYCIKNEITGKKYIGKTNNFKRRISQHKTFLKHGCHTSKKMQFDYDEYGIESFDFIVLEEHEKMFYDEERKRECELFKIHDSKVNGYNHINDVISTDADENGEGFYAHIRGVEFIRLKSFLVQNQIPKSEFTRQAILEKIERDGI